MFGSHSLIGSILVAFCVVVAKLAGENDAVDLPDRGMSAIPQQFF